MRSAAVTVTLAAVLLLVGEPAWAYRPFDGTDGDVADLGAVEIELGPAGYLRQGAAHTRIAPATRFNYGFAEDWEAVLEGEWDHGLSAGSGGSSLVANMFSLKHVPRDGFLQDKPGPSIASEFAGLLPGIGGDNGTGGSAAGIVSERWGWLTVHLNAVAEVTRQQHGDLFLGAILEGPPVGEVRPVAEVFHERDFGGVSTPRGLSARSGR